MVVFKVEAEVRVGSCSSEGMVDIEQMEVQIS